MPIIPQGATLINHQVGVFKDDGQWTYLLGMYPIYKHPVGDTRSFRITIAQLIDSNACRPSEIRTAFGISKSCVDRAVRKYRAGGIGSFYAQTPRPRHGTVLTTAEVLLALLPDWQFTREPDAGTGYDELVVRVRR